MGFTVKMVSLIFLHRSFFCQSLTLNCGVMHLSGPDLSEGSMFGVLLLLGWSVLVWSVFPFLDMVELDGGQRAGSAGFIRVCNRSSIFSHVRRV